MTTGLVSHMQHARENTGLKQREVYETAFEASKREAAGGKSTWFDPVREKAFRRFKEIGFPTLRDEDWKYTSVEPIRKTSFRFQFQPPAAPLNLKKIEPFLFTKSEAPRLVFVNGFYSKELSLIPPSFQGLEIGNMAGALKEPSAFLTKHLAQHADFNRNGFIALNTAFIQDGVWIHLPKGKKIPEPIHILHMIDTDAPLILHPRNLIVLEEGSRAAVIETFVSLQADASLTNQVSEIILEQGASLDYYLIQREGSKGFQVNTTEVFSDRASSFQSFCLTFGGTLVRNDLDVILREEEARCSLRGLYLTDHEAHVDNHTVIDHTKPQGTSDQLYKGILSGKSRAVFNGKVFVRKDAQKTDAHQTNKNLLLSEGATVDTKPQLEIFADDVKCTHGAAIGRLEEDAIFYLKSRGLSEASARKLLTYAFASEVIQQIEIEAVRAQCERWLWDWFER